MYVYMLYKCIHKFSSRVPDRIPTPRQAVEIRMFLHSFCLGAAHKEGSVFWKYTIRPSLSREALPSVLEGKRLHREVKENAEADTATYQH
jgi:hypothetical protein